MILDELVLHNFGVYEGRQTIDLTPPSSEQPVILFGGLNGCGKTTLLDGLNLALYGKRARDVVRGQGGYGEFLRRWIHTRVTPGDGAAVEIAFRHRFEGQEHAYRVHRSWFLNGSGVKEQLKVLQDGQLDQVLTETWGEQVEEFLPLGVSKLFLFDGEKIEALAEPDTSAEMLRTAVHTLLGLDLVDRLRTDLVVVERRKQTALKNEAERRRIDEARSELNEITERVDELVLAQGHARNAVERAQKQFDELEADCRREGGDLFDRREELEAQREHAARRLADLEEDMRDVAAGLLPLGLLHDLIESVSEQLLQEDAAAENEAVLRLLDDRDRTLIKKLGESGATRQTLESMRLFLDSDRRSRRRYENVERILGMSPELSTQVQPLLDVDLPRVTQEALDLAQKIREATAALVDLDRLLASVPDRESFALLVERRERARLELTEAGARHNAVEEELERARRLREQANAKLVSMIERQVRDDFEREDAGRIVTHTRRVRETLGQFRDAVLHRHLDRIGRLVLDSFGRLVRKRELISSLRIDPETFALELWDSRGRELDPGQLSAGERQLLAVSMLWGLHRASGRPLPAVIDTPLGRLDSLHRSHLVDRYFPHASHQVLLLSTDEEIDQALFERLRPHVGHAYHLAFDEARRSTTVESGYFWN